VLATLPASRVQSQSGLTLFTRLLKDSPLTKLWTAALSCLYIHVPAGRPTQQGSVRTRRRRSQQSPAPL